MSEVDIEAAKRVLPADEAPSLYDKEKIAEALDIEDKWKLLPAFLKLKGFVRQHVDSFNYLV